jgi:hypothetical protein
MLLEFFLSNGPANSSGHTVYAVGLRPLACWDCGFETCRRHEYLSVVGILYCKVEVFASGWSLVRGSPSECGVSKCDHESSIMRRPWPTRDCCAMGKKYGPGFEFFFSCIDVSLLSPVPFPFPPPPPKIKKPRAVKAGAPKWLRIWNFSASPSSGKYCMKSVLKDYTELNLGSVESAVAVLETDTTVNVMPLVCVEIRPPQPPTILFRTHSLYVVFSNRRTQYLARFLTQQFYTATLLPIRATWACIH